MDIFSGLASILSGGLTGILGSVATGIFEYKNKKLDIELQKEKFANEVALKKADAEIMQQEWAARSKVAEIDATAKVEVADATSFNTALTSEPKRYYEGTAYTPIQKSLMIGLDFVRGAVRPSLTLYLCGITTVIYFKAVHLMKADVIMPEMAYDLLTQIINTILYLTTTSVLFWFGTRNKTKQK